MSHYPEIRPRIHTFFLIPWGIGLFISVLEPGERKKNPPAQVATALHHQSAVRAEGEIAMSRTFILLFVICCLCLSVPAQVAPEPTTLVPGQPVEREIAGGESHAYRVALQAGQFVRVVAEQKAIDVALVLAAPDGKQAVEVNLTGAGGLEPLSVEAATSGDYRLTVRAAGSATLAGSYRVRLEVKAAATAQDRQRIAAEALMIEANELRRQGGKKAEQVIDKLQQALSVWRELSDPYWVAWSFSRIGLAYTGLGRYEKAVEYHEQALAISREVKNRAAEGIALGDLGGVYYRTGPLRESD
ncbi:MAG: tetratricopeptide repeat protein [Pyrinomonadaceae bacterium]